MMNFLDTLGIPYNTRIVLTGACLLGASAGVIGAFAVLRRRALTGDALAHASLPGVCVAFLVVGDRNFVSLLIGAFLAGLVGIGVIAVLSRWTRLKEDASIGIVLGTFFGCGTVLLSIIQRLKGGSPAGLDGFILGKAASMNFADVRLISLLALGTLLLMTALYKEFKLTTFDPGFARAQGWPDFLLDLTLLIAIALTVVIGLPAVGVVMMAALLIIPAVTARFWTERLGILLLLAAVVGMGMGAAGTLLSDRPFSLPTGPAIVLVGAACFAISACAAPRRGMLARYLAQRRFSSEMEQRLLRLILFKLSQRSSTIDAEEARIDGNWSVPHFRWLLRQAQKEGTLHHDGKDIRLTAQGEQETARADRDNRLWEAFLLAHPDLARGYAACFATQSPEDALPPEVLKSLVERRPSSSREAAT
ncbi:MAG: metal ABC transporter permease [Planctomycetes bacterium]|nr:metal ABC transporter permease [Planctomycetota bacterium]